MAFYFIKDTTLTDIANAIREKSGTEEKLNAGNFAQEIRKIEGGDIIINDGDVVTGEQISLSFPANTYSIFAEGIDSAGEISPVVLPPMSSMSSASVPFPVVGGYVVFMSKNGTSETSHSLSIDGDVERILHLNHCTIIRVTGTGGGTITIL